MSLSWSYRSNLRDTIFISVACHWIFFPAKSKNSKKKNIAAKKPELNHKVPAVNSVTASTPSAATAPAKVAAPVPSKTPATENSTAEHHVEHVEAAPPAPVVEPEPAPALQPEVNSNHVESVEPVKDPVDAEENFTNGSSSKSGSQVKLKYDYKESTYCVASFCSFITSNNSKTVCVKNTQWN